MIPASFEYVRVSTVDDALTRLASLGDDAKVLAGGHSLLPLMKLRLAAPEYLVDIGPVDELRYVRVEGGEVAIGALSRYSDLVRDPVLLEHAPLLAHVSASVGDRQVRHRGTIGGSLVHADAAADLPAAVLASDAVLVARGPSGERRIPASEFFLGPFTTPLEPTELLTEIRLPSQAGQGWGFQKFTRRAIDWAMVGVAVVGGRVGLVNMGGVPLRATATEEALASGAEVSAAAELAAEGTNPPDEPHATAAYRRHLARVLTRRALTQAG
ncbi:FAD binding domain-containing protein [Amycolatopsis nalaikhensis]|uniref:Xanthine dehydrogenase family protein subunit M n=1 Tax=Amycolatopsis nalaikhensis TaxID=715472 RepID=A0ABY8XG02_9PSEU|nr:xanthine dehydrogenase family protein subunit M [Amycolatopsis sp. 2-2]WIV54527.1 xanthine dehydrogenase family protein subunit M [Amycolatopsis sp. 2-2]